jgi:hypothetical protein
MRFYQVPHEPSRFHANIFLATPLGMTFTCWSLLQVSLNNRWSTPIYQSHDEPEGEWCSDRGRASQHHRRGNGGPARGIEEGAREGTWGGDGWGEEEESHVFPKNTHGGDQENHPDRHDYGNRYTYGNSSCATGRSQRFSMSSLPSEIETWEGKNFQRRNIQAR